MFERFTREAREIVTLAQSEARALGHGYIGIGLLREGDGIAARILADAGNGLGWVRAAVDEETRLAG
jgi:ATP-dependent Clp protease ATP-binding subunit ClpC